MTQEKQRYLVFTRCSGGALKRYNLIIGYPYPLKLGRMGQQLITLIGSREIVVAKEQSTPDRSYFITEGSSPPALEDVM